jgi:hypothetical protein
MTTAEVAIGVITAFPTQAVTLTRFNDDLSTSTLVSRPRLTLLNGQGLRFSTCRDRKGQTRRWAPPICSKKTS